MSRGRARVRGHRAFNTLTANANYVVFSAFIIIFLASRFDVFCCCKNKHIIISVINITFLDYTRQKHARACIVHTHLGTTTTTTAAAALPVLRSPMPTGQRGGRVDDEVCINKPTSPRGYEKHRTR